MFILGVTIAASITSVFAYDLFAPNVGFTPADDTWKNKDGSDIENTGEALDDLHTTCTYCKVSVMGLTWNFEYLSREEVFKVPTSGTYKLEVWGAQGGDAINNYIGGYGAYSTGVINLEKDTNLYINVGTKGESGCLNANCAGGYNGGGTGVQYPDNKNYIAGGGGATSISLSTGLLTSSTMRENLLIVAGGGAGAYYHTNGADYSVNGGAGGGKQGADGFTVGYGVDPAKGGTQSSGGTGGYRGGNGLLGKGGTGQNGSSGGGGGYYGGGSAAHAGSGGGSGYLNPTLTNKKMVMYSTNTKYESNEENTKTEITQEFNESANSNQAKKGNGFARITLLGIN